MLQHVGDHAQELQTNYGNVSAASIGAIQRGLLALEQQGAQRFIGEPMLNVDDLLQTGDGGRGVVNILVADKLMNAPTLYSTLLLWLLVGALRTAARSGRPRQAEARVLLRRSAPPVHRCAEGAARQDRAGRAADPLEGRRRLLRHAESARRSGDGAGPARQSRSARAARLHAARPEGGQGGRRNHARQPEARHGKGHHRACRRRSAGLVSRRQGTAGGGRARVHPAAGRPDRPRNGGGAAARHRRRRGSALRTTRRSIANPRTSASRDARRRAPPRRRRARPRRAEAGRTPSRIRSAASCPAAGARTASSKPSRRAPRERSARRSAAKSSAACWARCWAAGSDRTRDRGDARYRAAPPLRGSHRRRARPRRPSRSPRADRQALETSERGSTSACHGVWRDDLLSSTSRVNGPRAL